MRSLLAPALLVALLTSGAASAVAGQTGCAAGTGARCASGRERETLLLQLEQHHQVSALRSAGRSQGAPDEFTRLQGACRTVAGTTGDFRKFEADEEECLKACSSEPRCVAWEHKAPTRCESHWEAIDHAEASMRGFSCWVRNPEAGTTGPSTPAPAVGFTGQAGACRTASGGRGDYDVVSADVLECGRRCAEESSCVAYEHGPSDRCELHQESISRTAAVASYTCYVRDAEPTPGTTSAPTTTPTTTVRSTTMATAAPTTTPTTTVRSTTVATAATTPTPTTTVSSTTLATAAPTTTSTTTVRSTTVTTPTPTTTPTTTSLSTTMATTVPTTAPAATSPSTTSATTAVVPATTSGPPMPTSADGYPLDSFGIKQLFPSAGSHRDWMAEWQTPRTGFGNTSPDGTTGASFRGGSSNRFTISGGEMVMDSPSDRTNTPRYYIHRANENVELTAYFWVAEADYYGGSSTTKGPTLVVRSNHDQYKQLPCEARGYYMRLVPTERKFRFLKEFYHGSGTAYGPPGGNWGPSKSAQLPSFPWSQWVGVKFVVRTKSNGDVLLQTFMDLTDGADGGDWQLKHELLDSAADSEDVHGCPHGSVFGEGGVAFLRADSMNPIRWKRASLREVGAAGASQPAPWH